MLSLRTQHRLVKYLNDSKETLKYALESEDFDEIQETIEEASDLQIEIIRFKHPIPKQPIQKHSSKRKQLPTLPYEILVKILDGCRHTLFQTSLVSRVWFEISRNHLWNTINISNPTKAMLLNLSLQSYLGFSKTRSWPKLPCPQSIRIICALDYPLQSHLITCISKLNLSSLKELACEYDESVFVNLDELEENDEDYEEDIDDLISRQISTIKTEIKSGSLFLLGKYKLESFFLNSFNVGIVKPKIKSNLKKSLFNLANLISITMNNSMTTSMIKLIPNCPRITTLEFVWRDEPDPNIFAMLSAKMPNVKKIVIQKLYDDHDNYCTICISHFLPTTVIINGHDRVDFEMLSTTNIKLERILLQSTCSSHGNLAALFSGIGKSLTHCHISKIECGNDNDTVSFPEVINVLSKNVPKLESLLLGHSWIEVSLKSIRLLCKNTNLKTMVDGNIVGDLSDDALKVFREFKVDCGKSKFEEFTDHMKHSMGQGAFGALPMMMLNHLFAGRNGVNEDNLGDMTEEMIEMFSDMIPDFHHHLQNVGN